MTDNEIIIAVARLDGWNHWFNGWNKLNENNPPLTLSENLPPYLTSHDAIVPVIERQIRTIENIHARASVIVEFYVNCQVADSILFATPKQLSIALLKAVGKWREVESDSNCGSIKHDDKRKQLSMMTQTEQRIAIAEWMGWKKCGTSGTECWISPDGFHTASNSVSFPNYPLDLNAMHEAEKRLTDLQFSDYCLELQTVIVDSRNLEPHTDYLKSMLPSSKMAVKATSQQRSEALCRTLWPERFEQ